MPIKFYCSTGIQCVSAQQLHDTVMPVKAVVSAHFLGRYMGLNKTCSHVAELPSVKDIAYPEKVDNSGSTTVATALIVPATAGRCEMHSKSTFLTSEGL